jgi:hypothetical protein
VEFNMSTAVFDRFVVAEQRRARMTGDATRRLRRLVTRPPERRIVEISRDEFLRMLLDIANG